MCADKMDVPADRVYTKSHEWAKPEDGDVVIGITAYAVEEMGHDIVHIELPEEGASVGREDSFGVIDSVKAAFDLYAPVAGEIVDVNKALGSNPSLISDSPFDQGWMIRIRPESADDVKKNLSPDDYRAMIESGESH